MRRLFPLLFLLSMACTGAGWQSTMSIQEVDGSPLGQVSTLKVSNGTLSITGDSAYIVTGGGGAGGSGDITDVGDCSTGEAFLGACGTTLTFKNATSGTIALTPVTGALGTRTISLPAETGTVCTTGAVCSGYQASLGYTAENSANKGTSTSLGTSDTTYPSQNAVKTYVDTGLATKQASGTYVGTVSGTTPLHSSGTTAITMTIDTASASTAGALSAANWSTFNGKQDALGYTAANAATTMTIAGTAGEITSSASAQSLAASRTWTLSFPASINFTNKDTFFVPTATAPTIDTVGVLAFDSNYWGTGRGSFVGFDGTAAVSIPAVLQSDTCTNGQTIKFNTGGTWTCEADNNGAGVSITQYQVAYATTTDTVGGDPGFTYNPTTHVMTAGGFNTSSSASAGYVQLYEASGNGTNYSKIAAQASITTDTTWTLPTQDSVGVFQSNGAGLISLALVNKIESSTAPTVTAAGNIGVDTTDDQLTFYGSAARVVPYHVSKCLVISQLAATDDSVVTGFTFPYAATMKQITCVCSGTCTNKATISMADGGGNAFTMATPTCVNKGTTPTAATITTDTAQTAWEDRLFSVTNTITPDSTDTYEICGDFVVAAQ